LIEGLRVVLVGEPNVGKSTLANALTDRELAIVSDIPGTTRDFIEYPAAAEGLPLTIVDTAGVRDSSDALEQEAIRRTLQQVRSAEVLVRVLDASNPADTTPPATHEIVVWNKADLKSAIRNLFEPEPQSRRPQSAILSISALTGQGLNDLRRRLLQVHALSDWHNLKMCFTPHQVEIGQRTLSALGREPAPNVIAMLNRFSNSFR
jgi:tRNA modification GTPase